MHRIISMSMISLGLLLAGCGQQAAALPTTQPTSAPTAISQPSQAPTSAPTNVPTPSAALTSAATATPSAAAATGTPTASAPTTAPTSPAAEPTTAGGRVTDTPLAAASAVPIQSEVVALATRSMGALPVVGGRSLSATSVEQIDWSDSSLGCPDPAALYLAVITPGYKITLSDGSNEFPVHTNIDGSVMVWCNGGKPTPIPPVRS